jgi:uncharacterized protein (TIGR02646 family)
MRRDVFGTLRRMAGRRERCMYCEDSRGTDIEHFWPKSVYPERTFEWPNMLLSCAGCQRAKGDRFPLDDDGDPQLIDPTAEEPWDFLYYVAETGVVTPRYDPATGQEFPKGRCTISLLPLNHEAITEGRKRAARRLCRVVRDFLDVARQGFAGTSRSQAARELGDAVRDNRDYGLARWFLPEEGSRQEPFRQLEADYPAIIEDLKSATLS